MFTYFGFIAFNWCYPHAALSGVPPYLDDMSLCLFLRENVQQQAQAVSMGWPVTMHTHSVLLQSGASVYNKDMFSWRFNITKGQAISEREYYLSTGSETETTGIPPASSCEPGLKSRVTRFLMKGRMQSFTKGSKSCRGASGAQTSHRPEVLLKLQTLLTLLTLECFFSKIETGMTAPARNSSVNLNAVGSFFVRFILWSLLPF